MTTRQRYFWGFLSVVFASALGSAAWYYAHRDVPGALRFAAIGLASSLCWAVVVLFIVRLTRFGVAR